MTGRRRGGGPPTPPFSSSFSSSFNSSSGKQAFAPPPSPEQRQAQKIAELSGHILRALKRRVEQGGFASDEAVDVAMLQVLRPGGPRLNDGDRGRLRHALSVMSRQLEPPSPRALYAFAKDAAAAAWKNHHAGRSPGATIRERVELPAKQLVLAALAAEAPSARNQEELVRRAVHRAMMERRRGAPGHLVPLPAGDPLRELFDLPEQGRVRLPRGEIRISLARAAVGDRTLGGVLRQAAVFSSTVLQPLLGEHLWSMARPIGFSDKRHTRVLLAAPTSLMAQEAQLHSQEFTHRLKQHPAFKTIAGVRVTVDERGFHQERSAAPR